VLVAQLEAGRFRRTRVAHPDLAVGMEAATARGGHRGGARAMEQAGVGHAAIGMDAAVAGDDLVPRRLAPRADRGIGQRRAVELAGVEIDNYLVPLLDQG